MMNAAAQLAGAAHPAPSIGGLLTAWRRRRAMGSPIVGNLLVTLLALIGLTWAWDAFLAGIPPMASLPWVLRQQALYLSGQIAVAMMSLAMLLAARPTWLDVPLGGLDRMYRAHKWAGILGVAFGAVHWLIQLSEGLMKDLVGREGRPPKELFTGFLEVLRDLAQDVGEWAIYGMLAMLAIALWKRFPYRPWRYLHQAMPVLYLMLVFHGVLLAPPRYWAEPVGWLIAALLVGGAYGSILSLAGRIGWRRQKAGTVLSTHAVSADVLSVECQLEARWPGHRPGQFAFVTFDDREGAHPFTIASADRSDRRITLQIKALGDYTRHLGGAIRPAQPIDVEGPYGCFDFTHRDPRAQQIWIAGGIGITPFLAWLEALSKPDVAAPSATLHYFVKDRSADPFVARLESLCARLPGIRLSIHGGVQGDRPDGAALLVGMDPAANTEVWFCGPQGLADALKADFAQCHPGKLRFHQEAFVMR